MSITPNGATIKVGQQLQLASSGGGGTKWSSSNPGIATVDSKGRARGVAPGTVTITAKKGSDSDSVPLVVEMLSPTPIPPEPTPIPPTPLPTPGGAVCLLEDWSKGIRQVQPHEPLPRNRDLFGLYTDYGVGASVSDIVDVAGVKMFRNVFDQDKAIAAAGGQFINWQAHYYTYTLNDASGLPAGWHPIAQLAINPAENILGKFNRMRMRLRVPGSMPAHPVSSGNHNFEFGVHLAEAASDGNTQENNNWHCYHVSNFHPHGGMETLVIDTHPGHQRSHNGGEEYDFQQWAHPSTITPTLTFFDLMRRFYLDFPYAKFGKGEFLVGAIELYEDTRPEDVGRISTVHGARIPGTSDVQIGFQRRKDEMFCRFEVVVSKTDLHQAGWASATPVGVIAPPPGSSGDIDTGPYTDKILAFTADMGGVSTLFVGVRALACDRYDTVTGAKTAVPDSTTFRQITVSL